MRESSREARLGAAGAAEDPEESEAASCVWRLAAICARFDAASGLLAEAEAGELMSPMPLLHLRVLPKEEVDKAKAAQQTYECPYYVTNERQGQLATTGHSDNFVMMVNLPTDIEPSHWVRRGVALVAQTND